jgi:hypothetical protein
MCKWAQPTVPLRSAWLGVPGLLVLSAQGRGAGELWPQTRHGGGPTGSGQPAAMAGGGRQLGHEEVVGDPVEVGEGSVRLTRGCPPWCTLEGRSRRRGRGSMVPEWSVMGYASERSLWRRRCTWRCSRRLGWMGFGGRGVGRRSMALSRGSGSCGGPVHSSWRWWLDKALPGVGW